MIGNLILYIIGMAIVFFLKPLWKTKFKLIFIVLAYTPCIFLFLVFSEIAQRLITLSGRWQLYLILLIPVVVTFYAQKFMLERLIKGRNNDGREN